MIKRILLTSLTSLILAALCAGYFYHVGKIERSGRKDFICKRMDIEVQDSTFNRVITSEKIHKTISDKYLGMEMDSIPLHTIETEIEELGEVLESEVYTNIGALVVKVVPRTAALHLVTAGNHHFYCDKSGYLFPVDSRVDVQVITGNIPVSIGKNFKGYPRDKRELQWLKDILEVTSYIEEHHYWKETTSHLNINEKGEIELYPTFGKVRFIIGKADRIPEKFKKMELWYKAVAPLEKAAEYTEVNLEYDKQIICR